MSPYKGKKVEPTGRLVKKNSWRLKSLFRIEKIIREIGQEPRAKRIGMCGNTINILRKQENGYESILFKPELRCKDRLCPVCNSFRASTLARKVEKLGKEMTNPHMLTITASLENRFDLEVAFKNFKASMKKLKRDKSWFKKYISGGIEHIEVVFNKQTGWHIHSHMIVDLKILRNVYNTVNLPNGYEIDIVKKELEVVLERVGLGVISDIRPVTEGYGKEISKYCAKFALDIDDERLKEIIMALKGKRMVSKFGSCYGVKEPVEGEGESTLEQLTKKEEEEYESMGTIEKVLQKSVETGEFNNKYFKYVQEAIKIGLIELTLEKIEGG